jgi:hypothetical protein
MFGSYRKGGLDVQGSTSAIPLSNFIICGRITGKEFMPNFAPTF